MRMEPGKICFILASQVESGAHAALMAALWADTAWLAGQGVMDYSLLVGLDSPNGALVVGIIDFLRQVGEPLRWASACSPCASCGQAPELHHWMLRSPAATFFCRRDRGCFCGHCCICLGAHGVNFYPRVSHW